MKLTKKLIATLLAVIMAISMMPITALAAEVCPNCGSTNTYQTSPGEYECDDCYETFWKGPPCDECGSTNTQQMSGDMYMCHDCYNNFHWTDPGSTVEGDGSQYDPYMVGSYSALVNLCNSFADEWYEDYAPYIKLKANIEFSGVIMTLGYGFNLDLDNYHIDGGEWEIRFSGGEYPFTVTGNTGYINKLRVMDDATVNLNSGTIKDVTVADSTLVINGGSITEDFETDNHAVIEMINGTACEIDMDDTSEFTMTGGTVENFIHLNGQSTSVISGGTIPGLTLYGSAACEVSGGTFTAGSTVVNGGTLAVTGGDFSGQYGGILNYGGAVEVTGGTFGCVTNDSGTMALKGGNYEKRPSYYDNDEENYLKALVPQAYKLVETNDYFTVVPRPAYTITWKNYDGATLKTDTGVYEGTTPSYTGETPTKPEDETNTYTFSGWSPEVAAASADKTYTAQFNAVPKPSVLPTATVTDITNTAENTANLDKAYKFVANNDGESYADYQADFIVTFSQDVTSDDLELWGKYGAYDWTAISSEAAGQTVTYTANTPYYLLKDIVKAPMTYGQIASAVGTFYCGIKAKPSAAGTTVGVELAIYDDTAATPEPIEIESTEDYTVPALPTATVTDITNTEENTANLDKAYKFVANNDGEAYADYQADFIVTFSKDVTSDDLELWGKYGNYDWTAISSEAAGQTVTYEANKEYYLLKDIIKWPMTYGDIASTVGTFYCGLNASAAAAGTAVNVSFVIYDDAQAEPEAIVIDSTEEYVVPEAEAHNGSSLTLNDKIDTTIYIDADAYDVNDEEGFIKVTYNHNPANEVKDVKTDTIPLSDLEVYEGDAEAYVGTYMFTYGSAPAQITETCKVELYANEEATRPVFTDEYSAKQYCDKVKDVVENYDGPITSDSPLIKLYELCNALVDYGKAAQTQFNYGGDLTDPYNNEQVQTLAASDIVATDNVKAATAYGFAFDCTDDLNVIVYTQEEVAPTGVSMNATIYKDKLAAAAEKKDSTNFIRITGLGSGNINKVVTVSTANGDITVSPNAIAKAYVAADTMPSSMKDLARAIYLYGIATANYFGS